ncbi:MAG: PepSY domain-containing protein [Hyphomonas sp.]
MRVIPRLVPRLHNILGLIIGGQVLLWIVSGFFFTFYPIEQIRGEHLRAEAPATLTLPAGGLAPIDGLVGADVATVRLKHFLGGAVYETETATGRALFDAVTGARLSPLGEALARDVAEAGWVGDGALANVSLIDPAPRESGRGQGRAMWRADFAGKDTATFWIDPQTGNIAAVRTGLWRTYDLLWGLHIMDWTNRETFTSWWMKAAAFLSLVLTLAGIWLVIVRVARGRILR